MNAAPAVVASVTASAERDGQCHRMIRRARRERADRKERTPNHDRPREDHPTTILQPLDRAGERRRISGNGGHSPSWRRDSRELFYVDASDRLVSVVVRDHGVEQPTVLFRARFADYDDPYVAIEGGQRFLVNQALETSPGFEYTVLLDWRQAIESE